MNTEKKAPPRRKLRVTGAMLWGAVIVGFFVLVALLAPVLAPYDPHQLGIPYSKPCPEHLLGTNDVGQDILSELIFGTRVSLLIGVFTSLIVTVVATLLALLAGYYRGFLDKLVSAVTGRWQPLSGWSYDEKSLGPKSLRRAVPAGSAYFFELMEGDVKLEEIWLRSVCDDEQDRRDGLGLALWGAW